MLSILYFLYNRLIDGSGVVSLTRRPRSAPQNHFFLFLEGLDKLKELNDLIRKVFYINFIK
jgi:hypothetical protein